MRQRVSGANKKTAARGRDGRLKKQRKGGSGRDPEGRPLLLEEIENDARARVGDRQRLHAELLLNLQGL